MKHPLLLEAEQNERQMEFELEGIRKGIQKLNERIDYARANGYRRTQELEDFGTMIRDMMNLLGVGPAQVPARLRKYLRFAKED